MRPLVKVTIFRTAPKSAYTLIPTPLKPLYMKYLEGGGRWVAGGSKAENKVVRKNDQERQCDSMATQLKKIVFSIGKHRFLRKKTVFSML